jgi:hypothetical protein
MSDIWALPAFPTIPIVSRLIAMLTPKGQKTYANPKHPDADSKETRNKPHIIGIAI